MDVPGELPAELMLSLRVLWSSDDVDEGELRAAVNRAAARMGPRMQERAAQAMSPLGAHITSSWRSHVYDNPDGAAAVVSTPFSHIVQALSSATVIVAQNHLFLAIPTVNVPRVGHGFATPAEVEAQYGSKLIFLPSARPGSLLAVIDRGVGSGLPPYVGPDASRIYPVLMFILVRQVHLRKRIDLDAVASGLQEEWPLVIDEEYLTVRRK